MLITIKVISPEGWQNGEKLWPQGKILSLEAEKTDLQPFIDAGLIEIVVAKVATNSDDPTKIAEKQNQAVIDQTVEAVVKAMAELSPTTSSFHVRERSEDDPNMGFKSMAEFGIAVYQDSKTPGSSKQLTEYDARLKTTGHMAEGDDAQGGHLVPQGFRASLLQTSLEASIVRPRAMFVPMATNTIGIPALRDYTHASGNQLFTALKLDRPGEGGSKTASKPHFDKVTLTLHKNVFFTYVSEELIEDSPISIEPLLNNLFGVAMSWHEDKIVVPCRRKAA